MQGHPKSISFRLIALKSCQGCSLSSFQSDYHSDQAFDDTISTATTSVANQSVTPSVVNATTLKKGLLWQQRDKLFSRWKERFFVLTTEYLQCFKKGSSKISEMGGFIFRIRLAEVSSKKGTSPWS